MQKSLIKQTNNTIYPLTMKVLRKFAKIKADWPDVVVGNELSILFENITSEKNLVNHWLGHSQNHGITACTSQSRTFLHQNKAADNKYNNKDLSKKKKKKKKKTNKHPSAPSLFQQKNKHTVMATGLFASLADAAYRRISNAMNAYDVPLKHYIRTTVKLTKARFYQQRCPAIDLWLLSKWLQTTV